MPKFNEYGEIIPEPENEKEAVYPKKDFTTHNWENATPYDAQPIPPRTPITSTSSGGLVISSGTILGVLIGFLIIVLVFGGVIGFLIANRDESSGGATATAQANTTATAEARLAIVAQDGVEETSGAAIVTAEVQLATRQAEEFATAQANTIATAEARLAIVAQDGVEETSRAATVTAEVQLATRQAEEFATVQAGEAVMAQTRLVDTDAIEAVVRRYSDEIKIENTTNLDPSNLSEVLVDPVLEKQKRSPCWLRNNGFYYTYSDRSFAIENVTFESDNQATVLARIGEHRVLREQSGDVQQDFGYVDYRAIYQLQKMSDGKWYIYCFQGLEDNDPISCRIELEDDNPCN